MPYKLQPHYFPRRLKYRIFKKAPQPCLRAFWFSANAHLSGISPLPAQPAQLRQSAPALVPAPQPLYLSPGQRSLAPPAQAHRNL